MLLHWLCLQGNLVEETAVILPENPCIPSPCGPYSTCDIVERRPVCQCQPNYYGRPPGCRPECVMNSECSLSKACVHQRCLDPCPGSCGYNANCKATNHIPICYCIPGFTGDPFSGCQKSNNQRE